MTKAELLGRELIRHENACSDIKVFCDFIKSRRVETGEQFMLPDTGGDIVYCAIIDYDNLQIRYTLNQTEIANERELFFVPQKTINE